ncbi:IS982 family transposase, partial [Lactobacillus helveticus]|nr:IS982 family transposase [Lactobacillus helveticus]NHL91885.1 IS982 family transposase [Lactobacillus helveticus]
MLTQVGFKDLVKICRYWYRLYAPAEFTHRRNIDQIK